MSYFRKVISSPVGNLTLVSSSDKLVAVLQERDDPMRVGIPPSLESKERPILVEAAKQLGEYFSGRRKLFDLPIDFCGTAFQKKVWLELTKIPYGQMVSYEEIAKKIEAPQDTRAVGAANGRNPLSIIAACHRVIGKNGKLIGFTGGLKAKTFLLNLEARCGII